MFHKELLRTHHRQLEKHREIGNREKHREIGNRHAAKDWGSLSS